MKTIRSNKKGISIHSPFVYGLVTGVLFDDSMKIDFNGTNILQSAEQAQLNMLYRLLYYFRPEKVFFSNPLTMETEKKLKDKMNFDFFYPETFESSFEETILSFPFAVLSESVFYRLTHFPENNTVWFIKKCSRSNGSIFKNLPECECGRITIELKYSGIVIFNNKFYTQGYVIK